MFKNMRLRKRFTTIMLLGYICTLPIILISGYFFLKHSAMKEIEIQSNIMLASWEGAGAYTTGRLRPALREIIPLKDIPVVALKGFFIAEEIEGLIKEKIGNYSFKVATLNPRNPAHKPDSFELQLLNDFKTGKIKNEWKGIRDKEGKKVFGVIRPLKATGECLLCHGEPDSAPEHIISQYGKEKGFGWKEGEIVAIRAVYVPIEIPMAILWRNLIFFTGIYSGLFLIALIVLDRIIISNIIKPIEHFVETATEVSKGNLDKQFEVKTNDEMKLLADAFERMKVSLKKAIEILKK